jgi:hypothetical protein
MAECLAEDGLIRSIYLQHCRRAWLNTLHALADIHAAMIPMVLIWLNALHALAEWGHEMTRHGWLAALARMLSAIAAGGHRLPASHLPPATIAATTNFRQYQWWIQYSASPNGVNSYPPHPMAEIATCRL